MPKAGGSGGMHGKAGAGQKGCIASKGGKTAASRPAPDGEVNIERMNSFVKKFNEIHDN